MMGPLKAEISLGRVNGNRGMRGPTSSQLFHGYEHGSARLFNQKDHKFRGLGFARVQSNGVNIVRTSIEGLISSLMDGGQI